MDREQIKIIETQGLLVAKEGSLEQMSYLLKQGLNPNTYDKNGNTLLIHAIASNNFEMVKMLCMAGADPNINNELWVTPLMVAVHTNSLELVKYLVFFDVDISATDMENKTALDYAKCPKIRKYLEETK